MTSQQHTIIDRTATSEGDGNVSDIQTLTLRVQELTGKVDFWNTWMLWALVFAAVAAIFVVVTTRLAIVRSKDLSVAQGELGDAQARQFSLEVAQANQRAAEANEKAEAERLARVRLEGQVVSRHLTDEQKVKLRGLLKRNPGNIVIVSAVTDGESSAFADDFDTVFKEAGWKTRRYVNRITTESGVQLGTVEGTGGSSEVEEIRKELAAAGLEVKLASFRPDDHTTSPWFEKGVLYLVVNHKPEVKTMQ
jgi:hypothetical protein